MVSSARNPNESYAQRAKKANTSSASRTPQQRHQQPPDKAPSEPPSSLRPPQINVWAERIKEQKTHAPPQPPQTAPRRAPSSPKPARDDAIQPRSSPPDLSVQLAILDQQDEHDPFVVRVPPHLSRQSSSSTNPLPATDPAAWPQLPGADRQGNASPAGHDSPFLSAVPSRQNSTASFRHHAYSSSGSVRLSRVQSSLSQHSHSASQSRAHSRSGSSASSPRLQIRGRTLPHDDAIPPDLRLDHQHRRSSNQRSSPALPDPPNHISSSLDPPPADQSYYPHPLVPPLQDMPPRYLIHQYALSQQFSPSHVPGHSSPPYLHPSSGQGTPPYPHYPPFPAYMYGHHQFLWGDVPPPHSHHHFQNQLLISSNYINSSEHAVPHPTEFGSTSPAITIEPAASKDAAQPQNGWLPRPSKNVVFGTINLAESEAESSATHPGPEQSTDAAVERTTEQFAAFSIGVDPNEQGPSRLGSRKPSIRSLSRSLSSQPTPSDSAQEVNALPTPLHVVNGIKNPIRWEFGTTHSEDLDVSGPPSESSPTSLSSSDQPGKSSSDKVEDQPDLVDVSSSYVTSQADRSMDKSETDSSASDVWVVRDYGFGFGEHSANVPENTRWETREREKERSRAAIRDQPRDRGWFPARQPGRRPENSNEEGREQEGHVDAPRQLRPRRGSFHGYGGHDRGGFPGRRGRGFGGRFYGGRGRGGFFHHQRPGSYPFVPPPAPPPPSFEVLPPTIDVNGYGQVPYAPPELESYETISPTPQAQVSFTSATFSVEAMQSYLLGQLEYYLSPQNLAQDYYLRQRMDDEGWIPISLLASFKRVQQLQMNTDIVREVLSRSRTVEVSGDWARMAGGQWQVFVLPNAQRSVVSGAGRGDQSPTPGHSHSSGAYTDSGEIDGEHGDTEGDCDGEDCEDEDDDVEFVIGEEAEGPWMSVTERKQ